MPQQPKDRAPQHHNHNATAATIATAVRHDNTEWGGRNNRRSNTENEGPDAAAAAAAATPTPGGGDGCGIRAFSHPPNEPLPAQSSWRQLKKLDHHPRQISPSLVAALPAVVVDSGPPAADGGGHPHKRMRKVSTEEDPDSINIGGAGRGSYYAYNGSPLMVPGSEASSRRTSSSLSPPPSLPRLGFYLGSPLADSASSAAAAAAVATATSATAANKCSFSSDSDNNHHHAASHEWEHEQPRAAGGGRGDDDAAAAAVRVLGLRNGHMSAAAAAVAATQPAAAAVVAVGSKRAREAIEQAHVSMPAAVKIVQNPSTTTTLHGSGGGEAGGRRSSTGTRQRIDKR